MNTSQNLPDDTLKAVLSLATASLFGEATAEDIGGVLIAWW